MKWRFTAFDWNNSTTKRELRALQNVRMSLLLKAPSTLSFSIDLEHPHSLFVEEMITDVVASADGVDIARFRVGPANDSVGQSQGTVSFQCADYREVLRRRMLKAADTLAYSGVDQAAIAMGLIDDVQARTNGDYGIVAGVGSTTGVNRTRNFKQGQFVGKEIDDMSNVSGGFDWDINSAMELDVYYPQRGANNGAFLEFGKAVESFTRTRTTQSFANDLVVTASNDTAPVEVASATVTTDPMGRWDDTVSYPDISEQATLDDRADFEIDAASKISPKYNVRLKQGFWRGPSHIGLGDTVRLFVRYGRIQDDVLMRVYEIVVSPLDDGEEDVSMGLVPA